jgi:Protein of unknown function (DUF3500)
VRMRSRLALNASLLAILGIASSVLPGLARQRAAAGMAKAANDFLSTLTPEQRAKAVHPVASPEWTRWNFIPASMFPRNGINFKELNPTQRQRAHDLMKAGLSQSGYVTTASVMQLENVLREIEGPSATAGTPSTPAPQTAAPAAPAADQAAGSGAGAGTEGAQRGGGRGRGRGGDGGGAPIVRDPELYFLTVFGDPSAKGAWGWRLEGHHVSLRFAIDNGRMLVSSTPQFLGANPAEVPYGYGPYTGLRVLAAQEDAARALVLSLEATHQAIAIVAPKPRAFASGTTVKFDPQAPVGLAVSQMSSRHRDMLMKLIESYASIMPADIAAERMARMETAGIDKIMFAWSGATEKGQPYQYQVQGPTFLIEHNNTQNNGNHIHAVWRDFNGDFGRDVLAEHMASLAH